VVKSPLIFKKRGCPLLHFGFFHPHASDCFFIASITRYGVGLSVEDSEDDETFFFALCNVIDDRTTVKEGLS
jgi:hypothetical protein